jgi:mannosyltransferase OCH1-like enzyme
MDYSFISNRVVQYWDEGDPPSLLRQRMDHWRLANPDFSYLCFNRISAASAFGHLYGESLRKAFLSIRLPAMQSDVFRVAYLHACGGVWIDAATHCLEPLHHWLDLQSPLVLLRRPNMLAPLVSNGFIYSSVPQHPFLAEAMKRVAAVIENRQGDRIWRLVGAGMYRDILADPAFSMSVQVLEWASVSAFIQYGSSKEAMSPDSHWTVTQNLEPLYFD